MWGEVNQVLTTLHQQSALSTEMRQTDFEKLITRVTNFLRWLAVAMMVLLLILVVVKITGSVSQFWADVAIFLAVAQMCLAASWLVLDTLPAIVFVLFLNKQLFVIRQRESKHEFGQAAQLERHSVKTLKLTLIWLEIRIERMKLGLMFFVVVPIRSRFLCLPPAVGRYGTTCLVTSRLGYRKRTYTVRRFAAAWQSAVYCRISSLKIPAQTRSGCGWPRRC